MTNGKFLRRTTLREKCPNTYTGKYGPEKTPYLDTFHEVLSLCPGFFSISPLRSIVRVYNQICILP